MNKLPVVIDLQIPNKADIIYDYTLRLLQAIQNYIELDLEVQRKIKLIFIELVTNSIKHSSEAYSQIQIVIDHPKLSIQKLEKGLKIEFSSNSPQIPFEEVNKILKISFSEENKHQILPLDQYKFKFLNPFREKELSLDHLPEHFGFYIITLASDNFVYQYDPDLKESKYIVSLNLK